MTWHNLYFFCKAKVLDGISNHIFLNGRGENGLFEQEANLGQKNRTERLYEKYSKEH